MARHPISFAVALLFAAASIGAGTATGQIGGADVGGPNSSSGFYGGFGSGPYGGYGQSYGGWYRNNWNGPGFAGGYGNRGNTYYGYGNGPYIYGNSSPFQALNYNAYGFAPYTGYNGNGYGIENWDNVLGTSPVQNYR